MSSMLVLVLLANEGRRDGIIFLVAAAGQSAEEVNRVLVVFLVLRRGVINPIKVSLHSKNEVGDNVNGAVGLTETIAYMVAYSTSRALVATRPGSSTLEALSLLLVEQSILGNLLPGLH